MGLIESSLCRKYGVEEDTSAHVLCKCEVLATLKHCYLGSPQSLFFFCGGGVFVRNLSLGAVWNCGSHDSESSLRDTKALLKDLSASGPMSAQTHYLLCHSCYEPNEVYWT